MGGGVDLEGVESELAAHAHKGVAVDGLVERHLAVHAQQLALPHCVVITQLPFVARCTKPSAQL